MSAAEKLAAYWDWKAGAAVPDARIVVCAPQMLTTARLSVRADAHLFREQSRPAVKAIDALIGADDAGTLFVVPDGDPRGLPAGCVPALHITRQADLARLPDLLAVKAERRALVVSPEEAIDLYAPIDGMPSPRPLLDAAFIVGMDKPVRPDWVRSVVEQCRKAGVPVVLVTWGEWMPAAHLAERYPNDHVGARFEHGEWFWRVGAERSGAMLDGQPIEDVPEWLEPLDARPS